jgi:quercetin dioxygenase-like cupin family protein
MALRRRPGWSREQAIAALRAEGLDVTEWTDEPGATYEEHSHARAEVRFVLEGTMTIVASGMGHELGPGDRIDLAPGEPHAARVGPAGVRYLAATAREWVTGPG